MYEGGAVLHWQRACDCGMGRTVLAIRSARDESRRHHLSRVELRPRPCRGLRTGGAEVARVWHKDTALPAGVDVVGVPGGFSLRRLPALRGDRRAVADRAAVAAHAEQGRLCAGHLQRLSGADRDGPAAGRADAQRRAEIRLPDGAAAGGDRRQRLHLGLRGGREDRAFPIAHHDGNYTIDAESWRGCRARTASPSPMPRTPTAAWPTSRACCRQTAACSG